MDIPIIFIVLSIVLLGLILIISCNSSNKKTEAFDSCSSYSDCGTCTTQPSCGYSLGNNVCLSGTQGGSTDSSSSGSDWAWYSSQCPSSVDQCQQYTDCGTCTSQASCGYSLGNNVCLTGTQGGSSDNSSSGSDWAWVSSSCNVKLDQLVPIPSPINVGLTSISSSYNWLVSKLGLPGCPLSPIGCNNSAISDTLKANIVTMSVGPFRVTLYNNFALLLKRIFERIGTERPDLYQNVKSAGSLCCRAVRRGDGTLSSHYSNHSWGLAIDIYFGSDVGPRNSTVQLGVSQIATYFMNEKIYWGAGFSGSAIDPMHFEVSRELLSSW